MIRLGAEYADLALAELSEDERATGEMRVTIAGHQIGSPFGSLKRAQRLEVPAARQFERTAHVLDNHPGRGVASARTVRSACCTQYSPSSSRPCRINRKPQIR